MQWNIFKSVTTIGWTWPKPGKFKLYVLANRLNGRVPK